MPNAVDRFLPVCVIFGIHIIVALLLSPVPKPALWQQPNEHAVLPWVDPGAVAAIEMLLLPASIAAGFAVLISNYFGLNIFMTVTDIQIQLVSRMAGVLKMVVVTMAANVAGISATYSNWKRQGHYKAIRFMVLIPGLIFALFVNAVMYVLFFLPITCLAKIWDHFFVERNTEIGNNAGEHGDGAETISELDLNDGGNDTGLNLEAALEHED